MVNYPQAPAHRRVPPLGDQTWRGRVLLFAHCLKHRCSCITWSATTVTQSWGVKTIYNASTLATYPVFREILKMWDTNCLR